MTSSTVEKILWADVLIYMALAVVAALAGHPIVASITGGLTPLLVWRAATYPARRYLKEVLNDQHD